MMVNGKTKFKTAEVLSEGLTVLIWRLTLSTEKPMVMASTSTPTDLTTMASSRTEFSTEEEDSFTKSTKWFTMGNGGMVNQMERELKTSLELEDMKVLLSMGLSRVRA